MAQKININKLISGSGIIAVLFIIGLVLILANISTSLGYLAVGAAVIIGIVYALLGVFGIARRYR